MLSIEGSTGHAWRAQLCRLLPDNHDLDNDEEVQQIFAEGMRWADWNSVEHKRQDSRHYANQYLRTTRQLNPIVPKFMRQYIAFKLDFPCTEDFRLVPKRPVKPKRPATVRYRQPRYLPSQRIAVAT